MLMLDKKLDFRAQRTLRSIAENCKDQFGEWFVGKFDIFAEMLKLSLPLLVLRLQKH